MGGSTYPSRAPNVESRGSWWCGGSDLQERRGGVGWEELGSGCYDKRRQAGPLLGYRIIIVFMVCSIPEEKIFWLIPK